jgi:hypothetical protein
MPMNVCGGGNVESFMEGALSCGCELAAGVRRPLWRLFGLFPKDRRRSGCSTAFLPPGETRSTVGRLDPRCAAPVEDSLIEL